MYSSRRKSLLGMIRLARWAQHMHHSRADLQGFFRSLECRLFSLKQTFIKWNRTTYRQVREANPQQLPLINWDPRSTCIYWWGLEIEELPHPSSVIRGHLKRAFYVIRNALTLIADASQLDPTHCSWINQDSTLLPPSVWSPSLPSFQPCVTVVGSVSQSAVPAKQQMLCV